MYLFQINEVAVTTSRLPNRETFLEWNEFCLVINKLIHTCHGWKRELLDDHYPQMCTIVLQYTSEHQHHQNNSSSSENVNKLSICQQVRRHMVNSTVSKLLRDTLYNYARENLALVNIYIKQPVVTKILRDQRVPIIWFVANCGGILGLCMGFSIVTVFEVFHCIFKFFISKLMSCRCCGDSLAVRTNLGRGAKMRVPNVNIANRNHSSAGAVENTIGELQVTVNGNYNLTPANFVRNELVVLEANGSGEADEEDNMSSKIAESTDLSTGHLLVHSMTQTKKYSNNINL